MTYRTVLILGGAGFLGSHLASEYARANARVALIDRRQSPDEDFGEQAVADRVVAEFCPELIIHAAGLVGSDSEEKLRAAHVRSTATLLRAVVRGAPAARVLILGSASELGSPPNDGTTCPEVESGTPTTAYGRSKLEQSSLARRLAAEHDLDLLRVRLFNTLGPRQADTLVGGALVERLYAAWRAGQDEFLVYDPDSVRDFLDVRDISRVLRLLAETLPKDPGRTPLNVCSGNGASVATLARELVDAAAVPTRPRFQSSDRAPSNVVGDNCSLLEFLPGDRVQTISTYQSLQDMWRERVERDRN